MHISSCIIFSNVYHYYEPVNNYDKLVIELTLANRDRFSCHNDDDIVMILQGSVTDEDSSSRASSGARRSRYRPDSALDPRFYTGPDPRFYQPTQPLWLRTQNELLEPKTHNRTNQSDNRSNKTQHEHLPMTPITQNGQQCCRTLDKLADIPSSYMVKNNNIDDLCIDKSGIKRFSSDSGAICSEISLTDRSQNLCNNNLLLSSCIDQKPVIYSDGGDTKFRLPLDENGYLQPNMSKQPIYLDLVSDSTVDASKNTSFL